MLLKKLIALVLVCGAAACGQAQQKQAYPANVEPGFLRACEAQSQMLGLCDCVWNRIEAEIAPNDFIALERLPGPERATHPLMRQIEEMTLQCRATLNSPPEGEPAPAP